MASSLFDEGDGMKAGVGRGFDTAHHALVEVAELLSAKSGRAATDSGDLDVGTDLTFGCIDIFVPVIFL